MQDFFIVCHPVMEVFAREGVKAVLFGGLRLSACCCATCFTCINSFIFILPNRCKNYNYPHLTREELNGQRGSRAFRRWWNWHWIPGLPECRADAPTQFIILHPNFRIRFFFFLMKLGLIFKDSSFQIFEANCS